VERTIELIRHHLRQSRTPIFFSDDNFTANRRRTKAILERCLSEGIRLPRWSCQSRVEAAFDDDLLDLMVKSRLDTIMVGFESVNNESLRLWHKSSSFEKNREAIVRFHKKGICIHGMFVLGSDADTTETVEETIDFAKKMNIDTAQFFALTPIPGPPLTRKLTEQGRVLTQDWHLYDAQHVVLRPEKMTPAELQEGISHAFHEFYSPREGFRRLFGRGPKRLHNSLIRFLGRHLVNRIVNETLPHHRALKRLDDWLYTVDELCTDARTRLHELGARVETARADLSDTMDRTCEELVELKDHFVETLEARMQHLREGFAHLAEGYHPFCTRLLDELHSCFHSEAEETMALAPSACR
jgi:radical SAM superfamily enzyme YgiQ (UPF0313 family)